MLKTSGSAFEKFHRDDYTTLTGKSCMPCGNEVMLIACVEVADRIFSTSVTAWYNVPLPPNTPLSIANLPAIAKELDFPKMAATVRKDILEVFATDESASVQVSLPHLTDKFEIVADLLRRRCIIRCKQS